MGPAAAENTNSQSLSEPARLRSNALLILGLVFACSFLVYRVFAPHLALRGGAIAFALCMLASLFVIAFRGLPHHHHPVFGLANLITAVRASITCLVTAAILFNHGLATNATAIWTLIGLVSIALLLDGVDGYIARAAERVSPFGARFDMEVDALLILVLCLGAVMMGKVGWWILAIGLMRYGFVFAQTFLPELGGQLPPSFRRKLICVIQGGVLCFILVPVVSPAFSSVLCFVALLLLTYSFAVDTHDLLTREKR
ncbi:CDP-alcohol phosphatidyltransferase family protein [Rhizobium sp. L1K21]|uniref:CDP-alcohol phosphatidyltransferase family protein n=1 Tax=Rhizobium sp. L1K21 TaxID=2954933 RepID=UPI002093B42F|nr:CDP-alcohol phosphatidyltransferase family protein [Rhizobium sp. L1K21]MCO6187715.1 CDP-alcohol phosphatidyltransferase family protein [Rhizobium sp. L1K21]